MTRRTAAVLLLVAVVAAGCGKKGTPVAPEQRLPRPVSGLTATVRENAVDLTWTNPTRRADNTRVRDLTWADVYRTEDDGSGAPKAAMLSRGKILGYTQLAHISLLLTPAPPGGAPPPPPRTGTEPASWTVQGSTVSFTDRRDLVYGRRYTYVVVTEDFTGHVSPPSMRVSVVYLAPPAPPTSVSATAGQRRVELRWTAPTTLVDGSPLRDTIAYEVLRAASPDAPLVSVTPGFVSGTSFSDGNVENGRSYVYAVRAVRRTGVTVARGEPSARVTATPVDVTPPPPPSDLSATPSGNTVRLSWKASPGADVAGYIVYRATGAGDFARVGSTRAPATVFVDRDLAPGRYRYAVSAEDASARANESERSSEATVVVP